VKSAVRDDRRVELLLAPVVRRGARPIGSAPGEKEAAMHRPSAVLAVPLLFAIACAPLPRQQAPALPLHPDPTLHPVTPRDEIDARAVGGLAKDLAAADGAHRTIAAPREAAEFNTENYAHRPDGEFQSVVRQPLSTFSIDVDTASYANVRRFLSDGALPPADAVRIEELLNYFTYDDPPPTAGEPFSVSTEVASCPWNASHRLLRIGLRAAPVEYAGRRPGNFVFLIDVSGSMNDPRKLPLVQSAMKMLAGQLTGADRLSIAVYAGAAGLALPPTGAGDRASIEAAIDRLQAGGSTAGGEGIRLAYQVARENFVPGGINRVILATDGDFNVGLSSEGELVRLIEEQAASGVFLTVLGFGTGNLQDAKMEALADHGNGQYAYIDSALEARRALVEQAGGTLVTVARDVKVQVEFNPAQVRDYRLIGYENRLLAAEDFRDDAKDAGEIGAGHSVVALYELVPPGVDPSVERPVDPLRYQVTLPAEAAADGELATLRLRFKTPDGDRSAERSLVVTDTGTAWPAASGELKFAAGVAAFGMLLRGSPHRGDASFAGARELAGAGMGFDPDGQRAAFIELVDAAERLAGAISSRTAS